MYLAYWRTSTSLELNTWEIVSIISFFVFTDTSPLILWRILFFKLSMKSVLIFNILWVSASEINSKRSLINRSLFFLLFNSKKISNTYVSYFQKKMWMSVIFWNTLYSRKRLAINAKIFTVSESYFVEWRSFMKPLL